MLEVKLNQAFPDPAKFKNIEEFNYAALCASAMKKGIVEILMYIESQKQAYTDLNKRKKGKTKDFGVGR